MQAGATRRTAARNFLVPRGMGTAQGKKVAGRRCAIAGRGEAGLRADRPLSEAMMCGTVSPVERQEDSSCSVTGAMVFGRDRLLPRERPDHVQRWNDPPPAATFPARQDGKRDGTLLSVTPAGMARVPCAEAGRSDVSRRLNQCGLLPQRERHLHRPKPSACPQRGLTAHPECTVRLAEWHRAVSMRTRRRTALRRSRTGIRGRRPSRPCRRNPASRQTPPARPAGRATRTPQPAGWDRARRRGSPSRMSGP